MDESADPSLGRAASCLPDELLLLFISGRLSESARAGAEAHLDTCERCRRLLGLLLATEDATPPLSPADMLRRGDSIGRYLVLSLLGSGGMGRVYEAYDPELDRRVAIKLLHTARGSEGARRLLSREARALGKLSHPNVVQVHDVGEHEGDVFVAMELVAGESFDRWCRGPLKPSWQEVLLAYVDAARGISAAHAKGLIHRDVKPANLLRGHDGGVRVADFGLAATFQAEATEARALSPSATLSPVEAAGRVETIPAPSDDRRDGQLSGTAGLVGTPLYMAAEQLAGAKATAASDQYSLCAALYEGLYGELPFAAPTGMTAAAVLDQLLAAKRDGPPAQARTGSAVPAWIHRALSRGLAPDPADRYPSMDALIAALGADPEARRRSLYRRAGAGVATAVLLAVGAAGWANSGVFRDPCAHTERELAGVWDEGVKARVRAALVGTGRPHAEGTAARVSLRLDRYSGEWAAMRHEVCVAPPGSDYHRDVLRARDACLDRRRSQLEALTALFAERPDPEILDRAVSSAAGLYPVTTCADTAALTERVRPPEDPALRARVAELQPEVDRVEALYKTGKYKEGLALGEPLLANTETVGYAPLKAQLEYRVGQLHDGDGDYEAAKGLLRAAAASAAEGRDDALVLNAWASLLFIVGERQGRLAEAALIEGLGGAVVARAKDDVAVASWMNSAGLALQHEGKLALAKDTHERALAIRERLQPADHPDLAAANNNLGTVLLAMGDYKGALDRYERARSIQERALGPDHPALGAIFYNLGGLLDRMGDYPRAVRAHERALSIREAALGPEHAIVASSLNNLALALFHEGDYARALPLFDRALSIKQKAQAPDPVIVAYTLSGLGRTLTRLGRLDEALPVLERALEQLEKGKGRAHPDVAEPLLGLGELRLARNEVEAARTALERAASIADAEIAPEVHLTLADALYRGEARARARALAGDARDAYERLGHAPGIARCSLWLDEHPAPG